MQAMFFLHERPSDNQIPHHFSERDAYERDDDIGSHKTEKDAYRTAENRQESEEAHPCSVSSHESLRSVEAFFLHVEILFYPVETSKSAYAVIEHRAGDIAYGCCNDEFPRVNTRGKHCKHHCFA